MKKQPHRSLQEQIGSEILHALADILSDPNLVETLRLYMGADIKPITLLELHNPDESFLIDTDGQLIYTLRNTENEIPLNHTSTERLELQTPNDFNDLNLESISQLHSAVTRDDFLDRLAWQIGREGKPGYRTSGYDEERNTWRIKSADPDEHAQRRKTNRQHAHEREA